MMTFMYGGARTLPHFLQSQKCRIGIGEPEFYFGYLLIGEPQIALVLLFHELDDLCDTGLRLRWPGQHSIEHGFYI
jgi:hypothetical protein